MNSARECEDRFQNIVSLVMGELDPRFLSELQAHLAVCETCRAACDALREEEQAVRSGFETLARGLVPAGQAVLGQQPHRSTIRVRASQNHFLEGAKNMIIAHRRLSLAAAAVIAVSAAAILYVSMFTFSVPAYAVEQTVQANNHITSYHVKITPAAELGEAWVQLKPDGTPLRARMDLLSPHDGPKVVVLSGDQAEVWFKKKNSFVTLRDKAALAELMKMRAVFDPKLVFEQIQEAEHAGRIQIVTKEPAKEGEPVTLTTTSKAASDRREVCEVDPKTKLVERVTVSRLRDGRWEEIARIDYLDYNKEIDPKVFQFDLPKDVIKVDEIHEEIGLPKGSLSDDEIAVKVAREFFEALIAKDYKKAGMIFSGIPAEKLEQLMKQGLGPVKFLRIVEVGKPVPVSKNGSLQVPVKVELEEGGKKAIREFKPYVRAVHSQRDRFEIIGGI